MSLAARKTDERARVTAPDLSQVPTNLPLPPGRRGLPLVGETLAFLRDPTRFVVDRRKRYGSVFRTHLLGNDTVYLLGPEAFRFIFANEGDCLENRWNYAISRLLGANSVSMLNGAAHRARRRLLAPDFTTSAARSYSSWIAEITNEHVDAWLKSRRIGFVDRMRALAFEIATTLIFGDRHAIDQAEASRLFKLWVAGFFTPLPVNVPLTPFSRAMRAKQQLTAIVRPIVEARLEDPLYPSILGQLISARGDDGQSLSTDDIVDEVLLQLFAGHDTTVTAMAGLMTFLCQHPNVAETARAQVVDAWPNGTSFPASLLDTPQNLDHIIRESMRIIPPVSGAFRVATRDFTYGGYRIPAGWTISVSIAGAGRDPLWTEPERFDPARFAEPRCEHKRAKFAAIPFGGGPRLCLGQHIAMNEMRVVLATLLRQCTWQLIPDQDLSMSALPFPLPKDGLQLDLAPNLARRPSHH